MRGGVTVKAQDLKTRLPEDMFGEIREMHPLLTPKLTNATIKRAVRDYLTSKDLLMSIAAPLYVETNVQYVLLTITGTKCHACVQGNPALSRSMNPSYPQS